MLRLFVNYGVYILRIIVLGELLVGDVVLRAGGLHIVGNGHFRLVAALGADNSENH